MGTLGRWASRQLCLMSVLLSAMLLTACGGGPSNERNPPPDASLTPEPDPVPLSVTTAGVPDDNLRTCINELAAQNGWRHAEEVDRIQCEGVEIRSIEGLQQYPNLRVLNISVPRFDIDELPILVSLPLADFERRPFYQGDSNAPENAHAQIKQILLEESLPLPGDTNTTLLFLTVTDPSNNHLPLLWNVETLTDEYGAPMNVPLETVARGQTALSDSVSLHWVQFDAIPGSVAVHSSLTIELWPDSIGDQPAWLSSFRTLIKPLAIAPNTPLSELSLSTPILNCVTASSLAHNWQNAWQVTELDCEDQQLAPTDFYELAAFPQLRTLRINGADPINTPALFKLPYLERIEAPGLIMHPHEVDDFPWELSPPPTLPLEQPDITVETCGVQINNYDTNTSYDLVQYQPNDTEIMSSYAHPLSVDPWVNNPNHCVALTGPYAWRIRASKDGQTVSSDALVTDGDGNVIQVLYGNPLTEATMTVPGEPQAHYYVVRLNHGHHHLEQYQLESWRRTRTTNTSFLPLLNTQQGVVLIDDPRQRFSDRQHVWLLPPNGDLAQLPPMPLAVSPSAAIEYNNEVWLLGLEDEWGYRPEIVIWSPAHQSWRLVPAPLDRGALYQIGDNLCVGQLQDRACLDDSGQSWRSSPTEYPVYGGGSQVDLTASGERYYELSGLKDMIRNFFNTDMLSDASIPFHLAFHQTAQILFNGEIPGLPVSTGNHPPALLDMRDPDEPAFIGPVLPTTPWRSNYRIVDDTLYMLYNDSIARYPLPLP